MSKAIHLSSVRNACPIRREPYWGPKLGKGAYLGFRKISATEGSWVARLRIEDEHDKLIQKYEALGPVTDQFDYAAAIVKAQAWFATVEAGVASDKTVVTVTDACHAYVKELRAGHREATAHDADKRFERTVYEKSLGKKLLTKLTAADIKAWRDGLAIGKASSNRTLTALKAALNLARTNKHAPATLQIELMAVKPHKNAGKRRELYLDRTQRKALHKAAAGALRDLLDAVMLTGGRAGELTHATVSDFDARQKTLVLSGKTGPRTVSVQSPAALRLFKRLTKGKKPDELLLLRDDGKPWAHSDWDELVRDAAKAAELPPGVCLYTLRHSYITQAIAAGNTTLDVARQVGTSLTMIDRHYGQTSKDAAARLARVSML